MTFKVRVEPSGREFSVEAGETVLDAALRQGLSLPYGCRSGACGACVGTLTAGVVDYEGDTPALSEADRRAGKALFCRALPASDLTIHAEEVRAAEAIPVKSLPAKVVRMERFAEDVMGVWLKLPPTQRLQFLAGQYINIVLKDGKRRAFSIANPPHDDAALELHLRRIKGGVFTDYVFNEMQLKDILRIEGPHGSFFLREGSHRPIIMLATGTGIAPLKGMIQHALAEGLARPIHLYWGARHAEELYLDALLRRLAVEYGNLTYIPLLSQPASGWRGRSGHVQAAVLEDFNDLREFEVYACGLPAMVYEARDALVARGLPQERYYSDAFEFAKDAKPVAAAG